MSDTGSVSSASRKRPAAAMKSRAAAPAAAATATTGPKRRQLDTTRQGVRVWLVKVPVAVAEAIRRAQEGEKVGTLTVTRSSSAAGAVAGGGGGGAGGAGEDHRTEAVRLEEALCEKGQLPRDFTLEAPPPEAKMPRMYALRPDGDKGRMLVEGVVSRRTSLLPNASLDYRAFAKKRQIQHHRKERRLELIRDDWGPQQRALAAASGGTAGGGGQKKAIDLLAPLGPAPASAAAQPGGKGKAVRRMDEAGIRTALFRLFEERQAWRMKELLGRTGQAEADVKPVLRAIADNQMMGEHKGMWLLKPEYAQK